MKKAVTLAAFLLAAGAAGAGDSKYTPGQVIVKFKEVLNLSEGPGGVRTQFNSINKLNGLFGVYKITPLYDFLPTEPVNDPNGKWEWRHWEAVMKKYRYDTYYVLEYKANVEPPAVAKAYEGDPNVDFAERNFILELCENENK